MSPPLHVSMDNDIRDNQPMAWAWDETHSWLEPAMGLRLVCGVAFCFLGVGLTNAGVTQTPRHVVKRNREKVLMECLQDMDHDRMYWYRQDPGLGLRLLHFSYGVDSYEKGDFPDGYSVSRKKKDGFSLMGTRSLERNRRTSP